MGQKHPSLPWSLHSLKCSVTSQFQKFLDLPLFQQVRNASCHGLFLTSRFFPQANQNSKNDSLCNLISGDALGEDFKKINDFMSESIFLAFKMHCFSENNMLLNF